MSCVVCGCYAAIVMCCASGSYAFYPSSTSCMSPWLIKCWCLITAAETAIVLMNNTNRNWNILNWNIRGMNSEDKWLAIKQKIEESDCSILCLQETKRESFDAAYIKNFCPNRINKFAFLPSVGGSGGC